MNANELADELDYEANRGQGMPRGAAHSQFFSRVSHTLRQQQAEIEALKKEAALQRLSDFTQEADNEPVAWMAQVIRKDGVDDSELFFSKDFAEGTARIAGGNVVPLYTHPAKTLTDEEIKSIWKESHVNGALEFEIVNIFARAILKKASEK